MRAHLLLVLGLACACTGTPAAKPDAATTDIAADTALVEMAGDTTADTGPQCTVSSDCPAKTDQCLNGQCVAQIPCQSDKQCSAADLVCDSAGGVCVQCNEVGDCTPGDACKAHHCLPPAPTCESSKTCKSGLICDKGSNTCVECAAVADCNAGSACVDTVCVPLACKPSASKCASLSINDVCKTDGSGWDEVPCGAAKVCEDGACKAMLCTGGAKSCDGNAVVTCSARGTATGGATPCADKQVCVAGTCIAAPCKVGQVQCQNGQVATCKADGTGWDTKVCDSASVCSEGACVAKVCEPGQKFCDGSKQMKCDSSGASSSQVMDCMAIQSVQSTCLGGLCVPVKCTSGATTCADGGTVATCKGDGTGYSVAACGIDQTCEAGKCAALVCKPGEVFCSGSKIATCNGNGTASTSGEDCAASGKACSGGKCVVTSTCPTGAACEWKGGTNYQCCGYKKWQFCSDTCQWLPCAAETSPVAVCGGPQVCTPGSKQCNGLKLQTCKADGSGWDESSCDDGNACTVGDTCTNNACKIGPLQDADGDGFVNMACGGKDCDDGNVAVNPGKMESCATVGVDDNCNGQTDEGCLGLNAVGCGADGLTCGSGKGTCSSGHCMYMDAKGYKWTLVPAGTFWMGCNAAVESTCLENEKPQHKLDISAYWIGVYEVTVANYKACNDGGGAGCTTPGSSNYGTWAVAGKEQHPVNYVTWAQSQAYCKWLGGDLPTEAQWEKAARGGCEMYLGKDCATSEPKYEWGNTAPVCGAQAVISTGSGTCGGDYTTYAVGTGSKEGASPYGSYDMAGNLRERTLDWYDSKFYGTAAATAKDAVNSTGVSNRVTRGECFFSSDLSSIRAGYRSWTQPGSFGGTEGIRCARPYP